MSTQPTTETDSLYVELDTDRKIRHRNKLYYRVNHWPIWIFVFFIAPGPWTFDLFEHGFNARLLTWLGVVMIGTAIAGIRGRLPGCEPQPYIIRFTEDRPNPLYRRVCYTTAWGEVVAFAVGVEEFHLLLVERDPVDLVFRAEPILGLRAGADRPHLGLHHPTPVPGRDVGDGHDPIEIVLIVDQHTDAQMCGGNQHRAS